MTRERVPRPLPGAGFLLVLVAAIFFTPVVRALGPDVRVNQDVTNANQQEVDIAVNPSNPASLVCYYIEDPRTSMGGSYSVTGGATWQDFQLTSGCNGIDDDGDFFIDEEWCNGLDDDGDLAIDEDMCCPMQHFDPSVASDLAGNFTTVGIAAQGGPFFVGSSYVTVHRSTDGGVTWTELPSAEACPWGPDGNGDGFADNVDFLDKCWVTADANPTGPYSGHVYAAWQRDTAHDCDGQDNDFDTLIDEELCNGLDDDFDFRIDEDNCCLRTNANTHVYVARWDPLLQVWATRTRVDDTPAGECNLLDEDGDGQMDEELCNGLDDDSDGSVDEDLCCRCAEAPYIVVDGTGGIHAIWRRNAKFCGQPARFFVDSSQDGGATWGTDRAGPTYRQIPELFLHNHNFRTPDFPQIAVHPYNSQILFVVYAEDPSGPDEADVMFTWTSDGGQNWSTPIRINDDSSNTPQYWPSITVKPGNNSYAIVDVAFYDERQSIGCDQIDNDGDLLIDEELLNGLDDDGDGLFDEDVCQPMLSVFWTRSVQEGVWASFVPNVMVSDAAMLPPSTTNFLGDYLGLDSTPGMDFVAWTDTYSGGDTNISFDTIPDVDSDSDGTLDLNDCVADDLNVWAAPGAVQNVRVSKVPGGVDVSWTSQDALVGAGTGYDVVSGLVSHLLADRGYTRSSCLINQHPDTPYTDGRTGLPSGEGHYYLLRATNVCGSGGYGSTGPGDPRQVLEGNSPCPIP